MAVKSTKQKTRTKPKQEEAAEEPVWTYRGYKLKSGEFVTAMVHFFALKFNARMYGVNALIPLQIGQWW